MPPKKAAAAAATKAVKRTKKEVAAEAEEPQEKPLPKRRGAKKEEEASEEPPKKQAKGRAKKEGSVEPQKRQVKGRTQKEASEEPAEEVKKPTKSRAKKESVEPAEPVNKQPKRGAKKEEEEPQVTTAAKPSRAKKPAENGDGPKKRKAPASKAKKTAEEPQDNGESTSETKSKPKEKKAPKNATVTDWDTTNFKCTAKNPKGKTPNFHITSWNVDGVRAWINKGGLEILQHDNPDILCLQETKCSLEKLPEEIKTIEGYETYWCSSDKDGYAGVGVLTKVKPIEVTYGIGSEEHDAEGRCITLEFDSFYLVNVYVPNAGRKLVTLPKRLDWNTVFKAHVKKLDTVKPVVVCGDMNVSHLEIDLANPKANKKNAGFTEEERNGMTEFLGDGYIDTFRNLYPDKEKAYTFWTYMANARAKDVGWRLDYFIVSERFMEKVCDNVIHNGVLASDHCPLSLHVFI